MNADADTVHSKFDRMHARYRIPINRPAGHWKCHRPLGPLIKELHVTKKMSLLLVEEQREWRRRRRRAFVNSAKMNGRENASHTKGLADACISQIFLAVERSHSSSVSISYFSSFFSWITILVRPVIFPFDSYENPARGCTCTSCNFLRRVYMRNMNVYFSFAGESKHSHSRQVDNAEPRKNCERYSALQYMSNWRLKIMRSCIHYNKDWKQSIVNKQSAIIMYLTNLVELYNIERQTTFLFDNFQNLVIN